MRVSGVGTPMQGDPCGTCTVFKLKHMGGAKGGDTIPPRRKRRTPHHNKGEAYPGNWAVNNSPKKARR